MKLELGDNLTSVLLALIVFAPLIALATCGSRANAQENGTYKWTAVNNDIEVSDFITCGQYETFLDAIDGAGASYIAKNDYCGVFWISGAGGPADCIDRSGTFNNWSYSVQSGKEDDPIKGVTWTAAARYTNWENGSWSSDFGAYDPLPSLEGPDPDDCDFGPGPLEPHPPRDTIGVEIWVPSPSELDDAYVFDGEEWTDKECGNEEVKSYNGTTETCRDQNAAVNDMKFRIARFRPDEDGDGVPDDEDNCVNDANANQADTDSDGIGNVCDNCDLFANAGSKFCDSDSDGYGNACDGDFDNNLIINAKDLTRWRAEFANPNPDPNADLDCNGIINGKDLTRWRAINAGTIPFSSGWDCAGTVPCP